MTALAQVESERHGERTNDNDGKCDASSQQPACTPFRADVGLWPSKHTRGRAQQKMSRLIELESSTHTHTASHRALS